MTEKRRLSLKLALGRILLMISLVAASEVSAQEGPPGITQRTSFLPFNPDAPLCSAPPGLTQTLEFVQENDRQFLEGVHHGLSLAAKGRGLTYVRVLTDSSVPKAMEEIQASVKAKTGALIGTSSDPIAVHHSLQQAIWAGGFVGTIVPPPATLLLNAPQYATGQVLTDAAVAYINAQLGGKANVVLLTQDTMQYLAQRFEAMRVGLTALPGVNIIADIAPANVTTEDGFDTMNTILSANPDLSIDVVLGADAVVLGALEALRAANRDRPNQFLGGIDGEPEAIAEIKNVDSPYKVTVALSSPVFGFAMGEFAADWLEGRSIPQAMDTLPIVLTSKNIAQYEADLADPARAYRDVARRGSYLKMYGNICYDSRDQYVNFAWSSEMQ